MAQTSKEVLAYLRRWKKANPDKLKGQRARWRKRHPTYLRNWRRKNPAKVRAYRRTGKER